MVKKIIEEYCCILYNYEVHSIVVLNSTPTTIFPLMNSICKLNSTFGNGKNTCYTFFFNSVVMNELLCIHYTNIMLRKKFNPPPLSSECLYKKNYSRVIMHLSKFSFMSSKITCLASSPKVQTLKNVKNVDFSL